MEIINKSTIEDGILRELQNEEMKGRSPKMIRLTAYEHSKLLEELSNRVSMYGVFCDITIRDINGVLVEVI